MVKKPHMVHVSKTLSNLYRHDAADAGPTVLESLGALTNTSKLHAHLLKRLQWRTWDADLCCYYYDMCWEQLSALVPISALLIGWMLLFFGEWPSHPFEMMFGLACAVMGLVLFVDALRVCIVPLSDLIGSELPRILPLPAILAIAFLLGVLVTYAEPAIASLAPLAEKIDPSQAPFLYAALQVHAACVAASFFAMRARAQQLKTVMGVRRHLLCAIYCAMEWQESPDVTVMAVGIGVGIAAVLGTLRFIRDWPCAQA